MCFHPEFPDRAYSVIIHDYLSSGDLSRVDCSLDEPRRQHFQQLMRGMPWTKFIRDNANWGLSLVGWMRDRGVILPEGLEDSLGGHGFNPEKDCTFMDYSTGNVIILQCSSLTLLEQFLVSDMHKAVIKMVEAGWPREIEQLLRYIPGSHFCIPILLWACRHCYLDTIKFLVDERNAGLAVFENIYHCLHEVFRTDSSSENEISDSKRVEIFRFLVDEAGADITTRLVNDMSVLDKAGSYGRLGVVKYIHEEKRAFLKLEGSDVAGMAAYKFHYDVLFYLIEIRVVQARAVMDDFYAGVRYLKQEELFMPGRSLANIQTDNERAARRDRVKSYLKGLIGAEYDSDREIYNPDEEEEEEEEEEVGDSSGDEED